MPRVRSLYSRYFSTMGASSLWALAVFWKRAESETMSGEDRALLSSSYFNSVWSRRSNMGQLYSTELQTAALCQGTALAGPSGVQLKLRGFSPCSFLRCQIGRAHV